jgi:hypothetical protein
VATRSNESRASTSVLTTRHDFQDFQPEAHQQVIDDLVQGPRTVLRDRRLQQRRVLRLLHRLEDQRRVGGGIARRELRQLMEIAGVGNDRGVGLELFELVHGDGRHPLDDRKPGLERDPQLAAVHSGYGGRGSGSRRGTSPAHDRCAGLARREQAPTPASQLRCAYCTSVSGFISIE